MNPFSIFVSKSLVKSYQVSPELIMNLKNSLNPMLKFSPFCTLFVLSVPQGDSGQAPQMPHTCLMGSPSQIPMETKQEWVMPGGREHRKHLSDPPPGFLFFSSAHGNQCSHSWLGFFSILTTKVPLPSV